MYNKPTTLVTANIYRNFLTEKFLLVIYEKWTKKYREIVIELQQDNSPFHIKPKKPGLLATSRTTGLDILLVCNPTKPPELNFLNLVFLKSIQYLKHTKTPRKAGQLVTTVKLSFEQIHKSKLNKTFLTTQKAMYM